jgi:hypothetical protein
LVFGALDLLGAHVGAKTQEVLNQKLWQADRARIGEEIGSRLAALAPGC